MVEQRERERPERAFTSSRNFGSIRACTGMNFPPRMEEDGSRPKFQDVLLVRNKIAKKIDRNEVIRVSRFRNSNKYKISNCCSK